MSGWFKAGRRAHWARESGQRSLCERWVADQDLLPDFPVRQCAECARRLVDIEIHGEPESVPWHKPEPAIERDEVGALTVYDQITQGSPEWDALRRGMVSASIVGKLLTPTLKVASNDTSRGVTLGLIAERITGYTEPSYMSADMWRGVEDEPVARDFYAGHHGKVTEVGYMVRDFATCQIGYSPDGLVGSDGLIEIKSRNQKQQVATILADAVPDYNMAQLQCALLVARRDWIDYVSYSAGMPLYVKRVTPKSAWIEAILDAAEAFEATAAEVVARYRQNTKGMPLTERRPDFDEEII